MQGTTLGLLHELNKSSPSQDQPERQYILPLADWNRKAPLNASAHMPTTPDKAKVSGSAQAAQKKEVSIKARPACCVIL